MTEESASSLRGIKLSTVAKMCHEVQRVWQHAIGEPINPPWKQAPEWMRETAMEGVYFHCQNPLASPAASHEAWMAKKLADGWKHGPVKNPETKEHPCIVAFDQLPREQQLKDYLFRGVVHVMLGLPL